MDYAAFLDAAGGAYHVCLSAADVVGAYGLLDGVAAVDIAASHNSEPFVARFGVRPVQRIEHGWGPGMHRVDTEMPVPARTGLSL